MMLVALSAGTITKDLLNYLIYAIENDWLKKLYNTDFNMCNLQIQYEK